MAKVSDVVSSPSFSPEQTTTTTKRHKLTTSNGILTSTSQLPNLPLDLIAEILCRLPIKLLLQLRCLCKSFNSLISDPKFAKKHLRFSSQRHHIFLSTGINSRELILLDFPIPSIFLNSSITYRQLNYPSCLKYGVNRPLIVCSCDGILCITRLNLLLNYSAVLWNPSINKFKILPPLEETKHYYSMYCFGYDNFINNYKTICVSLNRNKTKVQVSVNTLGTDYWRKIQDFPYYDDFINQSGTFVSGTVNWLVSDAMSSSSFAIISLDLKKESYQKLSLPDLEADVLILRMLKDCLCVFGSSNMFYSVWSMKEYGNKESWTKLYSVSCMEVHGHPLYVMRHPLYVSEYGQMLIESYDEDDKLTMVLYDSKIGSYNIPEMQNIDHWMYPEVYIESMISPDY